jgi:hypothetical protein
LRAPLQPAATRESPRAPAGELLTPSVRYSREAPRIQKKKEKGKNGKKQLDNAEEKT